MTNKFVAFIIMDFRSFNFNIVILNSLLKIANCFIFFCDNLLNFYQFDQLKNYHILKANLSK